MEYDHRRVETEYFVVDNELYGVIEDEEGNVVMEGYTYDCRR